MEIFEWLKYFFEYERQKLSSRKVSFTKFGGGCLSSIIYQGRKPFLNSFAVNKTSVFINDIAVFSTDAVVVFPCKFYSLEFSSTTTTPFNQPFFNYPPYPHNSSLINTAFVLFPLRLPTKKQGQKIHKSNDIPFIHILY